MDMMIFSPLKRRKGTTSSNVNITHDSMQVTAKREVFLRNSRNKVQLIKLLKRQLTSSGIASYVSVGDADVMIVEKAINFASDKTDVAVVADDTDILILLTYHWKQEMSEIYFCTEKKESKKRIQVTYEINAVVKDQPNVEHILFVHAWGGCDTTSATHHQGVDNI